MLLTPLGIMIDVNQLQLENAELPMVVTLLGMVIDVMSSSRAKHSGTDVI